MTRDFNKWRAAAGIEERCAGEGKGLAEAMNRERMIEAALRVAVLEIMCLEPGRFLGRYPEDRSEAFLGTTRYKAGVAGPCYNAARLFSTGKHRHRERMVWLTCTKPSLT